MYKIILLTILLHSLNILGFSQAPTTEFNQMTITRKGATAGANPTPIDWKATNDSLQLNGRFTDYFNIFIMAADGCQYGKPLAIRDKYNYPNSGTLSYGSGIINGVNYDNVWYRGGMQITGSTDVPAMLRYSKRKTRTLRFPVQIFMYVDAFTDLEKYNANQAAVRSFQTVTDATATVTITRFRYYGAPALPNSGECSIESVKYEWNRAPLNVSQ